MIMAIIQFINIFPPPPPCALFGLTPQPGWNLALYLNINIPKEIDG